MADSLRILLVEDEPAVARVGLRMLEQMGHSASVVGSVDEAIGRLEQDEFDLVLSDQGLPDRPGLELAEWIRRERAALPFILTTGWATSIESSAVNQVLLKPYTSKDLREALEQAVKPQP